MGGSPSCGSDCSGSPWLPLLYIGFNLGFNIAALNLLKTAGESCGCMFVTDHTMTILHKFAVHSLALGPQFSEAYQCIPLNAHNQALCAY